MSKIFLENVNVFYPVANDHYRSIRRAALRALSGGRLYGEDRPPPAIHALKDITLELQDGDRVALVGRNGAGKSTLLKTIGKFVLPDAGVLRMEGGVTALFGVNGGLDIELSGYDNIFLMGRLLGMRRAEMNRHLKDIEEFSELGSFLNMPVRSYSDGMKVRLGFSIVTCLNPDILILDEAIGAGDAHFLDKAARRAQQLYARANIIVMASHDANIVRHLCNKAAWIDQGRLIKVGPVEDVLEAYAR
jgi:ABC-type polysaccharide/polyol phosphate transport system ATPase subunit